MKTKNWVVLLSINLVIAVLVVSPFLPGPANSIVHIFYNGGLVIGLLGFILVPIGFLWTIKELRKRKSDNAHSVDVRAVTLLTVSSTILISAFYISRLASDFSRTYAINRTSELILAIEKFDLIKGKYPDSLMQLAPEFISTIPSPNIMGITSYYYQRRGSTYNISFTQNVIFNFNFEVVTYDPTDRQEPKGDSLDIFDAGREHWKYYIYD